MIKIVDAVQEHVADKQGQERDHKSFPSIHEITAAEKCDGTNRRNITQNTEHTAWLKQTESGRQQDHNDQCGGSGLEWFEWHNFIV